jgi:hypothetical protein
MIYSPIVADGYEWINTGNSVGALQTLLSLDGTSRRTTWIPIKAYLVRKIRDKSLARSDFPWLGRFALVLREQAVESLKAIIERSSEILPLETEEDEEIFVLNTKTLPGVLDESKSGISRFPDGRIMQIVKPCFKQEVIGDSDLFRVQGQGMPTYVSERFVAAVYRARLVGLEFQLT